MALSPFSVINDDWEPVDDSGFLSPPLNESQPDQHLIFGQWIKDGEIRFRVAITECGKAADGDDKKEATVLFRFAGIDRGYCAGLGAYGAKFFIARMSPSGWQLLAHAGRVSSVPLNRSYALTVKFVGSEITLEENGVRQLSVIDESFQRGQWGLRTRKTRARYTDIEALSSKPVCFVIMPFASELAYVYAEIKKTVERHGFECRRADERYVARPAVEDIKNQIARADLIIVDFTGKNPNVYYEAGLADAWKKQWIVLSQSTEDLTFDVQHIRTILYSDRMGAGQKLCEDLSKALQQSIQHE
jgi:hypothetical protein